MSKANNQSGFCRSCGEPIGEAVRFCESCGAELLNLPDQAVEVRNIDVHKVNEGVERERRGESLGRGKRVMLAIGMVILVAVLMAWWVSTSMDLSAPPSAPKNLNSEELFPVKPEGVDSINNTIDGKKVLIRGDGHVMNSPGLGVNRPVWVLMGPKESTFTTAVELIKGKGSFTPEVQVLIPELVQTAGDNSEISIRLSLINSAGKAELVEYHLKAVNRWQKLAGNFASDSETGSHHLRFEANGFKGAIYVDLTLLVE